MNHQKLKFIQEWLEDNCSIYETISEFTEVYDVLDESDESIIVELLYDVMDEFDCDIDIDSIDFSELKTFNDLIK